MRVIELATTVPAAAIVAEHDAAYGQEQATTLEHVQRWVAAVVAATPVDEKITAVVSAKRQPGGGPQLYYDVSGRENSEQGKAERAARYAEAGRPPPPDSAATLALDFTEWGAWGQMPVEDATGLGLTPAQLAAHVYYEMTWHGFPDTIAAKHADLLDAVEQLDRDIAAGDMSRYVQVLPKPPEDEETYRRALAEVERLMALPEGDPAKEWLGLLARQVEAYEAVHYPVGTPRSSGTLPGDAPPAN